MDTTKKRCPQENEKLSKEINDAKIQFKNKISMGEFKQLPSDDLIYENWKESVQVAFWFYWRKKSIEKHS